MKVNFDIATLIELKLIYLIFGIILLVGTIFAIKRHGKFRLFDFFTLYYLLNYSIAPLFTLEDMKNGEVIKNLMTDNPNDHFVTAGLILFVYGVVFTIYKIGEKWAQSHKNKKIGINIYSNKFRRFLFVYLVFAWICLVLWTSKYGSVFGMFQYASLIRDGHFNEVNSLAMFSKFCSAFPIIFYYYILILKNDYSKARRNNVIIDVFLVTVSFLGTVINLINLDGRANLVIFILMLFLLLFEKKIVRLRIRDLLIAAVLILVVSFLVSKADSITHFINTGTFKDEKASSISFVSREFSYVYVNSVNIPYLKMNSDILKDRIWDNIREIPYAWVPMSMKPDDVTDMNDYNTSLYPDAVGENPVDLVSGSILTMGWMGVILVPAFYAFMILMLEKMFYFVENDEFGAVLFYYLGVRIMHLFVSYIDIGPIMVDVFGTVVFYVSAYIIMKNKKTTAKESLGNDYVYDSIDRSSYVRKDIC